MLDPYTRLRAQIRAGRELLGLTQGDVADMAESSLSRISRAESGETKSGDVLLEIKGVLENAGVRFTTSGVEIAEDQIELIEGEGCYPRLLDEVYRELVRTGEKEFLVLFANDEVSPSEVNQRYHFMRQQGIVSKKLIEEGNVYIMGKLEEYRYVPQKYFSNIVTVIYADRVAQANGRETRITIQKNPLLAERERLLFNYLWDIGKQPTFSTAKERYHGSE